MVGVFTHSVTGADDWWCHVHYQLEGNMAMATQRIFKAKDRLRYLKEFDRKEFDRLVNDIREEVSKPAREEAQAKAAAELEGFRRMGDLVGMPE